MNTLKETELRVLTMALPTGIIDGKSLFGVTPQATRKLRAVFAVLHGRGYLSEHIVAHDTQSGRDFRRSYITQSGFEALCCSLPPGNPLRELRGLKVNIRTGRNDDHLSRMVRYSDVSCFLACAGVDTAVTCTWNLNRNPFFVSHPRCLLDSPNLEDIVKRTLFDHGSTLPSFSKNDTGAVYLQSDYVDTSRKYNNNLGLLIDFKHKDVYMVFKSLFRVPLRWYAHAYLSCLGVSHSSRFKNLNMRNLSSNLPKCALLIVDTKAKRLSYIDSIATYKKPFSHLYVFLRRAEGFQELYQLLNNGLTKTLEAHLAIASRVYGVTGHVDASGYTDIQYQGKKCFLGTLMDLARAAYFLTYTSMPDADHKASCFICFEDQVDYYSRVISRKSLLSIPRS